MLACALTLAACTVGDAGPSPTHAPAVPEDDALAGYALTLTVVDEGLAEEAEALDASIYVAAPLLTKGTQAVIELRGDLAPLTAVDVTGASLAALGATDDALVGLSRACVSDNGGYAFCARPTRLGADGAAIDEDAEALDLDHHAIAPDPDGEGFWALRYVPTPCDGDVHPCDFPTEDEPLDRVLDCEVVHVRDGKAVWEWSALEHVADSTLDAAATTPIYEPADPFHCNSVQPDDAGEVAYVSMRHPSTVMAIDVGSGEILWTLGIDATEAALEVEDPEGLLDGRPVLSGQHDFRWLGGDRFSVFDNGSGGAGPARFIVFSVAGGTATVETVVEDPDGRESRCTGSARPLDADERFWAVSWGCSETGVSVMTDDGREVARLAIDLDAALEADLLVDVATEQPDLGHTVSYQAVVARPGLLD